MTELHDLKMAFMTGSTCGYACWLAQQDTCRCSCYGKNHGIMLKDGAEQPRRMSQINGAVFYLATIGNERSRGHEQLMRDFAESEHGQPFSSLPYPNASWREIPGNSHWNKWNARWWTKTASASQMKWAEAQPFANPERPWDKPRILWVHESMIDAFDTWIAEQE